MPSTFGARIDQLKEQVGRGQMQGKVVVDQVYAYNQEVGGWINYMGRYGPKSLHPRHGGQIHALQGSLESGADDYMRKLADGLLQERGLYDAMVDNVEDLSSQYAIRAPVETGALRGSAHPTVTDDGAVVYDRAPAVPRLSAEELRDRSRRYPTAERSEAKAQERTEVEKPRRQKLTREEKAKRAEARAKKLTVERKRLYERMKAAGGERYKDDAHNEALAQQLGFENYEALKDELVRLEGAPPANI